MKNTDLMDAMGGIKTEYIVEAAASRGQKKVIPLSAKRKPWVRLVAGIAAAAAFIVALPNTSPQVANAMQNLPVVGNYFKLVTFRDYHYESRKHSADISVDKVAVSGVTGPATKEAKKSSQAVNREIAQETDRLTKEFKASLKKGGYGSLTVKTKQVTNNRYWYVVKLTAVQTQADSGESSRYYVFSKASGKQVKLGDLFKSGSNYQKAISQNIIKQMKQEMKADKNKSYFLKENGNPDGFSQIKKKQQFYINKKNQVVIVFNQGEVGPMSMGSQSFVLPNKLVAKLQR
ncbi:RsiV family protein [Lactobacillus delbrueckii]|uniref:RsiV family protein n=1 Tax=Lactobacillus delbrueckii TaxID=1584 RepID=UPI003A8488BD